MNEFLLSEVAAGLIVQTTLLIAVTYGIDRWLGDSRTSCRLWTVCFVGILTLVIAGAMFPHFRPFTMAANRPGSIMAKVALHQTPIVHVVAMGWIAGVAIVLIRRAMIYIQLSRFLRKVCRPITSQERQSLPIQDGEIDDSMNILICDSVESPFCWQLHRPTIVLPQSLLSDSRDEQRHVLLHEWEHLKTNHPLQHFLQGICASLFWFHPAIAMAGRRAELVREFACDETAALSGGKVSSYLRTLAKIAERSSGSPSCVLSFGRSKSALIRRSEKLVSVATRSANVHPIRRVAALAGLVLTFLVISQVWLPVNALASSRSHWSPWPTWSAEALHDFGINVRDFESFDEDHGLHDFLHDD